MFVSSYATYISTSNSQKVDKKDVQKNPGEDFASKLSAKSVSSLNVTTNLPVNYISNYKALNNQQKLQQNSTQNQEKTKFTKMKASVNAQDAYANNSKIFSLLVKPRATLDQTPRIDKKLPSDIQEIKESNLRHTMVNTYLANDKYYQITA